MAARTEHLYMHQIFPKCNFMLPRTTKLLCVYAHLKKPIRSLTRTSNFPQWQVCRRSNAKNGYQGIRKLSSPKYGILNTQISSHLVLYFVLSVFHWLKNFEQLYASTQLQIITHEIASDCTQQVTVQIEHLPQNRKIHFVYILSIENEAKISVRRKCKDEQAFL